jgi:hypothetical protein
MRPDDDPHDRWIDAMAPLVGLSIDPAHRPGVRSYLQLASTMAERVMGWTPEPHDEPAPVFRPVAPEDLDRSEGAR